MYQTQVCQGAQEGHRSSHWSLDARNTGCPFCGNHKWAGTTWAIKLLRASRSSGGFDLSFMQCIISCSCANLQSAVWLKMFILATFYLLAGKKEMHFCCLGDTNALRNSTPHLAFPFVRTGNASNRVQFGSSCQTLHNFVGPGYCQLTRPGWCSGIVVFSSQL